MIERQLRKLIYLPAKVVSKREFNNQTFSGINERPIEYGYVFKWIGMLYPERILDVGTGTTALPHLMRNCGPLVTAIDNINDYWTHGMVNRHYHVLHRDIASHEECDFDGQFDMISCVSVLEHIANHDKAMENMFDCLVEGGYLLITCPYTENSYHENVYQLPESNLYGKNMSYICQSYSRDDIDRWLEQNNGELVDQEFWQCWSGEYWRTGDKVLPPVKVDANDNHQLTCFVIRKKKLEN